MPFRGGHDLLWPKMMDMIVDVVFEFARYLREVNPHGD